MRGERVRKGREDLMHKEVGLEGRMGEWGGTSGGVLGLKWGKGGDRRVKVEEVKREDRDIVFSEKTYICNVNFLYKLLNVQLVQNTSKMYPTLWIALFLNIQ